VTMIRRDEVATAPRLRSADKPRTTAALAAETTPASSVCDRSKPEITVGVIRLTAHFDLLA
jgi:hypothetical protein